MKIKKSAIGLIVLALISIILITSSPFQIANNLVENNGNLSIKNIGQEAYAADDDGGGDSGDSGDGDSGGSDDSDDSGDSNDSGDEESNDSSDGSEESSDESEDSSEEYEQSSDNEEQSYDSEENVASSYENEATETEEKEVVQQPYDDENDGWYGGPKDSEGYVLAKEDWPTDSEYDNEDERGQLPVSEQGFREYLKGQ